MAGFDVTAEARQGYATPKGDNPHYWSSPAWLAFEAGRALAAEGHPYPVGAYSSRGYSVRLDMGKGARGFLYSASGRELDVRCLSPTPASRA